MSTHRVLRNKKADTCEVVPDKIEMERENEPKFRNEMNVNENQTALVMLQQIRYHLQTANRHLKK
jgi:hypothetical protein